MKIESIKSYLLSNALHLQFVMAVLTLIKKFVQNLSGITAQTEVFRTKIDREDLCYKVVRKSDISAAKEESDRARDTIVAGIKDLVKSALKHFDADIRAAAQRIKIVIDTFDSPQPMISLPYDAETAVINSMLQELDGKYAAEVQITGLTPWVEELRKCNSAFEALTDAYNEQQAKKPSFQLKNVRKETDRAYQDIITIVNAFIIMEGEENYAAFVSELNTLIKHYNNLIAQHHGRLQAKNDDKTTNDEELPSDESNNRF
jgi:hypothetical protein